MRKFLLIDFGNNLYTPRKNFIWGDCCKPLILSSSEPINLMYPVAMPRKWNSCLVWEEFWESGPLFSEGKLPLFLTSPK